MIVSIAEHAVEMSMLPEKATILDIGCRGFLFTNHMRSLGHIVYPVDIDFLDGEYSQLAITGKDGRVGILHSSDPQATQVKAGNEIPSYTIASFSDLVNVNDWDLIKMDCEGSEYEIIMGLKGAPATQLSIEMHLHTGAYGDKEVMEMETKLIALGYRPLVHDKTKQHGLGFNYWDSLWVL